MCQLSIGFVLNKHTQTFCTPRNMKGRPSSSASESLAVESGPCVKYQACFWGLSEAPLKLELGWLLAAAFWSSLFSPLSGLYLSGLWFSNLGVLKSCWYICNNCRISSSTPEILLELLGSGAQENTRWFYVEGPYCPLKKWLSDGSLLGPHAFHFSLPTAVAKGRELALLLRAAFQCPWILFQLIPVLSINVHSLSCMEQSKWESGLWSHSLNLSLQLTYPVALCQLCHSSRPPFFL